MSAWWPVPAWRTTVVVLFREEGADAWYAEGARERFLGVIGGLIDEIRAHHGRIDAVFHAAGLIEDKLVAHKTAESFERVFDTKVAGALTLVEKLRDDTRLIVFFSSAAAVFGNAGQTDYAAANDVLDRLAIHLSESPEEVEFLKGGTGGLADIFGANEWGGVGVSPVRYAQSVDLLAPQTIAAHLATGVSEEDIEVLAQTGVAVAHCPRSNAYLGCGVSPVPAMIASGIRVGMGTDGLWSSPSMNLFEETLFAVELHGMSGAAGLELATLGGARALGIEAGTLEVGKWADLAVVETSQEDGDPERSALEAAAGGGVAATVVGGDMIYNRLGT